MQHEATTSAAPEAIIRILYAPPYGGAVCVGETVYVYRGADPTGKERLFWTNSLTHGGRGWDEGWGYASISAIVAARKEAFYRANSWRGVWRGDISVEISTEGNFPPAQLKWWSEQKEAAFASSFAAAGGVAAMLNQQRGAALLEAAPDPTYQPEKWEDSAPSGWVLKSIDPA